MRFHLLTALLLAGSAPALAQKTVPVEKRVDRLEQEMRAVQRKVFPSGNVEPEIRPETVAPAPAGVPSAAPVAELTARVDSLERQLATLTGQIEQNDHRVAQMEDAMNRFRAEAEARLAGLEAKAAPPQPAEPPQGADAAPGDSGPETAAASTAEASSGDPAEDAYNSGFRLWQQKKYPQAQTALEAMAKRYPKHSKASWARNLQGRALLDDGKPAAAAKVFLNNYQTDPKGERAPDSLLYLGQALTKLGKTAEACQVYGELQDVYGATLRPALRDQLPKARAQAKCSS